jgi:hypothetical protein
MPTGLGAIAADTIIAKTPLIYELAVPPTPEHARYNPLLFVSHARKSGDGHCAKEMGFGKTEVGIASPDGMEYTPLESVPT